MEYESRKKLRTAVDESLSISHFSDHTFITNPSASKYATAWMDREETNGRLEALESQIQSILLENQRILTENAELTRKYEGLNEVFNN